MINIDDCIINVTGEKDVYAIETVLFRHGVHWADDKIGERFTPISGSQDKCYLCIQNGIISYKLTATESCMDIYSFKEFMDKYNNDDKMFKDIEEDCTILIQNAKELYEFETFVSQKGIRWATGHTHIDFESPVMAIDIDLDDMELIYAVREDKDKNDSDEYTYAEFMCKYKKEQKAKIDTKYTLNNSLYRRKRVNLNQNN